MKILIVEDDPLNYRALTKLLDGYGEVEVAVNGKSGLAAFEMAHQKKEPIDLILLDLLMPEMDGFELLQAIRDYERDKQIIEPESQVQIVISSAQEKSETIFKGYEMGAHHYFLKPYNKIELEELMENMGFKKNSEAKE